VDFHARVGHRQGLYPKNAFPFGKAFCFVQFRTGAVTCSLILISRVLDHSSAAVAIR
jgi:hypothetical protein